jgi:hypothetical protein
MKTVEGKKVLELLEELGGKKGVFYPKEFPLLAAIHSSDGSAFVCLRKDANYVQESTGSFANIIGIGMAFALFKKDKLKAILEFKDSSGESHFVLFQNQSDGPALCTLRLLGMPVEGNDSLTEIFLPELTQEDGFMSGQKVYGDTAENALTMNFDFIGQKMNTEGVEQHD